MEPMVKMMETWRDLWIWMREIPTVEPRDHECEDGSSKHLNQRERQHVGMSCTTKGDRFSRSTPDLSRTT